MDKNPPEGVADCVIDAYHGKNKTKAGLGNSHATIVNFTVLAGIAAEHVKDRKLECVALG